MIYSECLFSYHFLYPNKGFPHCLSHIVLIIHNFLNEEDIPYLYRVIINPTCLIYITVDNVVCMPNRMRLFLSSVVEYVTYFLTNEFALNSQFKMTNSYSNIAHLCVLTASVDFALHHVLNLRSILLIVEDFIQPNNIAIMIDLY